MDEANKIALRRCRFLSQEDFPKLYAAFIEAFSDYVIPFALSETQFRNHIALTAVDLERSIGCEVNGRIVGFSLNGFGAWHGKVTVYDAGTGVVPSHRRLGISRDMFEMMIPILGEKGVKQFLLEVVTTNVAAVTLYENLGFHPTRTLALLQRDQRMESVELPRAGNLKVREIGQPDWSKLTLFWSGEPSWQNSVEAVDRSRGNKRILGAFVDEKCVGYIVFSSVFGRIAQLAVHPEHRRRGVATSLIVAMQAEMAAGFSMQVINIDKQLTDTMGFFERLGFYERVNQYEMVRPM